MRSEKKRSALPGALLLLACLVRVPAAPPGRRGVRLVPYEGRNAAFAGVLQPGHYRTGAGRLPDQHRSRRERLLPRLSFATFPGCRFDSTDLVNWRQIGQAGRVRN
jgi:hypothetical protein